jgi:Flp pilus assembly pilin Flp
MPKRPPRLRQLARDERGATLVEYIVIVGLVALCGSAAFKSFGRVLLGAGRADGQTVACIPGGEGSDDSGNCGSGSGASGAGGPSSGGSGPVPAAAGAGGAGGGSCLGGLCTSPGNCFVAGTPVLTPHGAVAIETLQEGDLVVSRDEAGGFAVAEPIARTFRHSAPILALRIGDPSGHEETIRVTPGHLVWTFDEGWKVAGELAVNEAVDDVHGRELRVLSATALNEEAPVYNFEVSSTHTYFVGELSLWVHNGAPAPDPIGYDHSGAPVYSGNPPFKTPPVPYQSSNPTYRADNRPPEVIFNQGFQPKYPNGTSSLDDWVTNHNPGPWISTSTDQSIVAKFGKVSNTPGWFGKTIFGKKNPSPVPGTGGKEWVYPPNKLGTVMGVKPTPASVGGGYVYTIGNSPGATNAYDANQTMGDHIYSGQNEITYAGSIPPTQIMGVNKINPDGTLGPFVPNPKYTGASSGSGSNPSNPSGSGSNPSNPSSSGAGSAEGNQPPAAKSGPAPCQIP